MEQSEEHHRRTPHSPNRRLQQVLKKRKEKVERLPSGSLKRSASMERQVGCGGGEEEAMTRGEEAVLERHARKRETLDERRVQKKSFKENSLL